MVPETLKQRNRKSGIRRFAGYALGILVETAAVAGLSLLFLGLMVLVKALAQ